MVSNKYRKRLLKTTLLLVLAILFIFQLSIRPTIKLRNDVKVIEQENNNKQDIKKELTQLEQKQQYLNTFFLNTVDVKEEVRTWDFIVKQSDSLFLFLSNYPEIHTMVSNNEFCILSQEVLLRGDYIDIIKFIHAMEQNNELFTHSALFTLETNRKTAEKYLVGKLYLQQIVKNNRN